VPLSKAKELLKKAGLQVTEAGEVVFVSFGGARGSAIDVMVFQIPNADYYSIASSVATVDTGTISRDTLLELFEATSAVALAKLEFIRIPPSAGHELHPAQRLLIASSECAVQTPSGKKLARRAEACADLTGRARAILTGPNH
jgi:hypothetical protein